MACAGVGGANDGECGDQIIDCGRQATDPSVTIDEIRLAYRQAVRLEHPDTSDSPDAEAGKLFKPLKTISSKPGQQRLSYLFGGFGTWRSSTKSYQIC